MNTGGSLSCEFYLDGIAGDKRRVRQSRSMPRVRVARMVARSAQASRVPLAHQLVTPPTPDVASVDNGSLAQEDQGQVKAMGIHPSEALAPV
jgi:hypothetical protein